LGEVGAIDSGSRDFDENLVGDRRADVALDEFEAAIPQAEYLQRALPDMSVAPSAPSHDDPSA
jgi:hypothetical protein